MIKTLPASTLLLIFLTITAIGQTASFPDTEITWDYDSNCATKNNPSVKAESPQCERAQTDQGTFYIVKYKGLAVAISYVFPHGYIRTTIQVTNHSGQTQDIDPVLSKIEVFISQSAFQKGKDTRRILNAISADLAKELYLKENAKYSVIDPFDRRTTIIEPSIKSSTTTSPAREPSTRSGPARTVFGEPHMPAPEDIPRIPIAPNTPSQTSLDRFNYAIRTGPIANDEKAVGFMFFEPVKDSVRYLVFRIKIGDLVFVFPEETPKDKKRLSKKD
jgi:hypothetical protein